MVAEQTPLSQVKPPKTNKKVQEAQAFFASHARSHRLMWGHILWLQVKVGLKNLYASQQYLADRGDIGRPQANLNLHVTKRHGLLSIRNRGYKKTCITSIPSEYLHPTVLLDLSDIFPWLYDHVRYALLINCSKKDDRTQVLYKIRKRDNQDALTQLAAHYFYTFYNQKKYRAAPLPGAAAHEPPIVEEFLKEEDYERFAQSINAFTD